MTSCRRCPVVRSAPSLQQTIFVMEVDDTHACQEAFQDVATDVELVKGRHVVAAAVRLIGRNSQRLQRKEAQSPHKS